MTEEKLWDEIFLLQEQEKKLKAEVKRINRQYYSLLQENKVKNKYIAELQGDMKEMISMDDCQSRIYKQVKRAEKAETRNRELEGRKR